MLVGSLIINKFNSWISLIFSIVKFFEKTIIDSTKFEIQTNQKMKISKPNNNIAILKMSVNIFQKRLLLLNFRKNRISWKIEKDKTLIEMKLKEIHEIKSASVESGNIIVTKYHERIKDNNVVMNIEIYFIIFIFFLSF